MKSSIEYIDRESGSIKTEKVYGQRAIQLLYGDDLLSKVFGTPLLYLSAKVPLFSHMYGYWQRKSWTRKKIAPFIDSFQIQKEEMEKTADEFASFDEFFSRKLKKHCRPIAFESASICPADGRYLAFTLDDLSTCFQIKSTTFTVQKLLSDEDGANRYKGGSVVVIRLAPPDYHRFHFPVDGTPESVRLINGSLFSVNPFALSRGFASYTENKRMATVIKSTQCGLVTMVEVGATNVGSIHQTYIDGRDYQKGEEKGFFSFGGSAIVLLFEKGKINIAEDLLQATKQGLETFCKMGQPLSE